MKIVSPTFPVKCDVIYWKPHGRIKKTDRQNRLFDQRIYKLHTMIVQIDDQETATRTKIVAIVAATF